MDHSPHKYQDLINIFNQCFSASYNTQLEKGGDEPIYLPQDKTRERNTIVFAHGFYRSALHEVSHWLIAGAERRKRIDFGYWYEPDGRNIEQQQLFEKVEVKPQALEWIFCVATKHTFEVSVDNLNGEITNATPFKLAVYKQVVHYLSHGLPERAQCFCNALADFYNTKEQIRLESFCIKEL